MGDADEATTPQKVSSDDPPATTAPDIDVVNLSCQMTSMDILPGVVEPKIRVGKKRVRFSIPDPKHDTRAKSAMVIECRRREAGEYLVAKRRVSKLSTRRVDNTASIDDQCRNVDAMEVTNGEESSEVVMDEFEHKASKRRKQDKPENINSNCATKGKGTISRDGIKRGNSDKGKSKSDECLWSKYNSRTKKVVSKKKSVKDDGWGVKYSLANKRKTPDFSTISKKFNGGETKKRKISHDRHKKEKDSNTLRLKYPNNNRSRYRSPTTKAHLKSKLKAKRTNKLSSKLRKAKEAKKKRLIKKANDSRKIALKRKQALKRQLAEKRKAARKDIPKIKDGMTKKRRKIKIIPIKREEEVSECLRVNLLKFLTIDRAYSYKYECCRHYCWDKWEELDIDDVIADFD